MKLREIFCFETAYQLRRASTWFYVGLFLALTFMMAASFTDNVRNGDYLLNAPVVTAAITAIATLLGLLVAAAVAGNAATHAVQANMEPLLYTSPISKFAYLAGRFFSAFAISALVLATVPIGLILAYFIEGADATLYGPFQPFPYLSAYFLIALPNMFAATAILFTAASLTRHALASFLTGGVLFMLGLTSKELLADQLGKWALAKQLDFSTFTLMSELKHTLTPLNINTEPVSISGWLLWNRSLWLMIALAFLAFAYFRFQFAHHVSHSWGMRLFKRKPVNTTATWSAPVIRPLVQGEFSSKTYVYQTLAIATRTFLENMLSWAGLATLAAVGFFLLIGPELLEGPLGVPGIPTTGHVAALSQDFTFRFVVVALITLYAGQLVWRERDVRMNDIADAAPVPDGVLLVSKLLSISFMLLTLQLGLMVAGMILQTSLGYYKLEIGLYLRILFGLQLVDYLLFAVVAMTVQVLVNQKYMGYSVVFLAFLFTVLHGELGVDDNLLIYGADAGWTYSDMSGFGHALEPWLLFKLYWAGWAMLLAVAARLFWVRDRETSLRARMRRLWVRPSESLLITAGIGAFTVYTLGAFVFYNTNTLNGNSSANQQAARRAAYERQYGKYRNAAQPLLTATNLRVELYPDQRRALINGVYTLVNKSLKAIDTLHLATASEVKTGAVKFDRAATAVLVDADLGYAMYILQRPLQPGDSLQFHFEVCFSPQGFPNRGIDNTVVENGTFIDGRDWIPAIGYQPERELAGAGDRKLHKLPARPAIASLANQAEKYNQRGREKIRFNAIVGTTADQTAVAPGSLRSTWTEKGRRYFFYTADAPILNIYAFFSARYAVRKAQWKDVQIEVYYHPEHSLNIERMLGSAKASLAYYTKHFGPYPHRQLKLVEKAGPGSGATAFAGIVEFSESFATLNPDDDPHQFDLPFAVVAHEIAHQWWAHQLTPAPVEGAALLTESLAWYSAMGVVEETYGPEHLQRLLYAMRQSYLTPRSRADVPLLRANDFFQAYRKGPFAMYTLREYLGANRVNEALRRLLVKYGSVTPLPTSLDLYQKLQETTPDSLHYLLADLFEKNTFWEVETESALATPTAAGEWQVKLEVQAQKVQVDTAGVETQVPMEEWVEVGAYTIGKEGEEQLYLQRHHVHSGRQQLTFTVPRKPTYAGIDPRNLLIDTNMDDNIKVVQATSASSLAGAQSKNSHWSVAPGMIYLIRHKLQGFHHFYYLSTRLPVNIDL
ncbi:M1 family aminopeptidase [Pontibacter chitinilyticus]|uniref:M1 family aminopeptidase n=1 Tax=Pontibacter chitinilyticus TaxID=2674989 RepID=UPI0032199729